MNRFLEIATSASAMLSPLLPLLWKYGESALESAASKLGEEVSVSSFKRITELWNRIRGHVPTEQQPTLAALERPAADSCSNTATTELELRALIRSVLEKRPELAQELQDRVQKLEAELNSGRSFSESRQVIQNFTQRAEKIINIQGQGHTINIS